MAAPATPSSTLPKSRHHQSSALKPDHASESGVHPGGVAGSYEDTALGSQDSTSDAFSHPDHVIPPPSYEGVENLVIVCCHGIFHPDASSPSFPLSSPYDEANWHLAPFQQSNPQTGKPGEHETFVAHVLAGLDIVSSSTHADDTLLILSGGPTKASLTSLSEARSYYHAALAHELLQGHKGGGRAHSHFAKGRILLEEHATDSFQNLLLSIILFRRATGTYPKQIRIITHAFKAKRFLELHAQALRWPKERIQVQGIDPVMASKELEETVQGEDKFGYAPWLGDPLGVGEVLSRKRKQRGWDESTRKEIGEGLEESVQALLRGTVPDDLPWMSVE